MPITRKALNSCYSFFGIYYCVAHSNTEENYLQFGQKHELHVKDHMSQPRQNIIQMQRACRIKQWRESIDLEMHEQFLQIPSHGSPTPTHRYVASMGFDRQEVMLNNKVWNESTYWLIFRLRVPAGHVIKQLSQQMTTLAKGEQECIADNKINVCKGCLAAMVSVSCLTHSTLIFLIL